jgi:phosphoglycolate phosphatase
MIDAVIFDKDGTLFDFRRSWGDWAGRVLSDLARDGAHRAAMAEVLRYDPETNDFGPDSVVIAGTTQEVAEALLPLLDDTALDRLVERLNGHAAQARMAEAVPLRPLMEALRARGLRIGLATNDTEAPARTHLASHGIDGFFDFIAGYDSGFGGKPAPGQLLAFAAAQGVPPARIAMVGDSLHDMEAARAAGMARVAVLTGIAAAPDLAPHADVVLPDIGHLEGWLDRIAAG